VALPLTDRPAVRAVLRVDAGIEALLAMICLVLAWQLAGTEEWVLPSWLGTPALLAAAGVLVIAAVGLCWMAGRPAPGAVRGVGIGNALTAVACLIWAVLGLGAGTELRVLVGLTALTLAALSATQFLVVRK
jgi:hypothetical protein